MNEDEEECRILIKAYAEQIALVAGQADFEKTEASLRNAEDKAKRILELIVELIEGMR